MKLAHSTSDEGSRDPSVRSLHQATASLSPAATSCHTPRMAATSAWQRSAAENKLRIQKLADACISMASLGNRLLAE